MADPTDHDRIVTLEARVQDLRDWRVELTQHLDHQFATLDSKVDQKVDGLEQHFDRTFQDLRDEMRTTLDRLRMALPGWAQIAIYALIGLLGVAATLVATGHP